MDNHDIDRLLEQGLSGEPPKEVFRARVLLKSTTALACARQGRNRWRLAALSAAAVFIAVASFLLGRYSMASRAPSPTGTVATATEGETVSVPADVVTWMKAARLFKQLGMENRVALAYDRAGRLMPPDGMGDAGDADPTVAPQFADALSAVAAVGDTQWQEPQSGDDGTASTYLERRADVQTILAQALGD